MAVLVQEQLSPEVAFVLHTAQPLTRDSGTLQARMRQYDCLQLATYVAITNDT